MTRKRLAVALAFFMMANLPELSARPVLPVGYQAAALAAGIQPELGYAEALEQSATILDTGCKVPWPWTLNLGGKTIIFQSRAEAHAALLAAITSKLKPIKVGLMQLDGSFMGDRAVALLDPQTNLLLGMKLLKSRLGQGGRLPASLGKLTRRLGKRPYAGCNQQKARPADYAVTNRPFGTLLNPRSPLADIIRQIARLYRVDPTLVTAVIRQESGFKACAVSSKNAQGLMQLIPETQRRFGVIDPCDPKDNIRGGVAYLNWLLRHFNGDVALALAGYNAGEKAVEKYQGIPPYPETRHYVRRIMAAYPNPYHPIPPPA